MFDPASTQLSFLLADLLCLRSSSSSSLSFSMSSSSLSRTLLAPAVPSKSGVDGCVWDGLGEALSLSSGVDLFAMGADIDVLLLLIWDEDLDSSPSSLSKESLFSWGSTFSLLQRLTLCCMNLTMSHRLNSR